ncbi:hypothetical protein [Pseudomonas fluorescens]|uniref:Uncharacterized protein n=1 Tax=Pseudomonas fluorescens TaxID=294 RepID=A0AAE2A3G1_PSEFL|nr:hypothetical protein [Pseudomonas fluorescens]KIF56192.1 hypothetical protein QS95_25235 [Pseudomonas fluorescens]
MMSTKTLRAFAVIGEGYVDTTDQLEVAATDGVQLAVFATTPAAIDCIKLHGEEVREVVIVAATDFDRVAAERDALQQRLNAADQRIDEQDQEREKLIAYGRSLGLDEASTLCSRMAYDEYYPAGSRFRFFTPKAQAKLGNVLVKAANAIANLPAGPYERFRARVQKKANGSANMIDHDHVVGATEKVAQPFTEQFIEDHLGKMPNLSQGN